MDGIIFIIYCCKMIGFLVKKTFFDLWDNMFRIAIVNLGFIVSISIPLFLPSLIPVPALSLLVLGAGIGWCFVYLAAAAFSIKEISDYKTFYIGDFLGNIRAAWPAGIFLGALAILIWAMAWFFIPFYLEMNSLFGLFLAAVIFWTILFLLLSLQFYFSVRARLDTKLFKALKKCFILFFGNPGFSVFSFLLCIAIFVPSALLAFLLPGPAGILLFLDEALRLQLLKYDWLQANTETEAEQNTGGSASKRRKIPWGLILAEEREKTGTRSLKNLIFPWKY